MKQHNIFVTEQDMEQLRPLLEPARRSMSKDLEHLETLEQELDRAHVVSSSQVPADLVTMNSKVRLKDMNTRKSTTYTLVFPRSADFASGRISVLAPIGTAILGYRVGDVIESLVPGGKRRLRVEEILYQPEAAGAALVQDLRDAGEALSAPYIERPSFAGQFIAQSNVAPQRKASQVARL